MGRVMGRVMASIVKHCLAFFHIIVLFFLANAVPALAEQVSELKEGDPAPDFTLPGSDGKTYSLSQFKGESPVVIAFFPKAFTSGCTLECKTIAESKDILGQYNVTYFMASVDEPELNKKFAEKHEVSFPILSDPSKAMAEKYGVLSERGFAVRWTFYIDEQGIIKKIDKQIQVRDAGKQLLNNFKALGFQKRS